jgi:hypothetical protein
MSGELADLGLAEAADDSKAPWFEITDGLPQHQDYPPPR